jgi:tetratricopeptide (TPR) repeat protein
LELPSRIHLRPCDKADWKEEEAVYQLGETLQQLGFRDSGFFRVTELPRYRLWMLIHRRESVCAVITEHYRRTNATVVWLELSTHYRGGTTFSYTTLDIPDRSRTKRPSHAVEYFPRSDPSTRYKRLLQERTRAPLRRVTAKEFPVLFEEGFRQFVAWRKLDDDESYYADLIHNNLGRFVLPAENAELVLRQNLALLAQLGAELPRVATYRSKVARWRTGLGLLYATLGEAVKAEVAYRDALRVAQTLVRKNRDRLEDATTLGRIHLNVGILYRDSGRLEAGLEWLEKAISTLERVLARDSAQTEGQCMLRHACRSRAIALTRLGRHTEALADWNRLLELDQLGKPGPRWQRIRTLARLGERDEALREAEFLARKGRPTL